MDDLTPPADRPTSVFIARLPVEMNPTDRLVYDLLLAFEQITNRDRQIPRELRLAVHHRIGVAHECLELGREPREVLAAVILPLFDEGT